MPYSTRAGIENVYGKDNVLRWADADNTGDSQVIRDRINWAIKFAQVNIDSRLLEGPYEVPFSDPVPDMIALIADSLAGVLLYDTRRITDADDSEAIAQQRRNVEMWIRQIFKGQLKLAGLEKVTENSPRVVESPDPLTTTTQYGWG